MSTKRNSEVLEKWRDVIDQLTFYDHAYLSFALSRDSGIKITQMMLRIITGISGLIVRSVHVEHDISNLLGRGIRMDVYAVSDDDMIFDAEFQRAKDGAKPQRARFNSSIIDANLRIKGMDTNDMDLPVTFVIFITEDDVLGGGLPIYNIERTIRETGRPFGDGSHIIYVNGAHKDTTTELGKLIHDLRSPRADGMLLRGMADFTREVKETETEAVKMGSILDKLIAEGIQQGRQEWIQEGRQQGARDNALSSARAFLENGVSIDIIARSIPMLSRSEIMAMDAQRRL